MYHPLLLQNLWMNYSSFWNHLRLGYCRRSPVQYSKHYWNIRTEEWSFWSNFRAKTYKPGIKLEVFVTVDDCSLFPREEVDGFGSSCSTMCESCKLNSWPNDWLPQSLLNFVAKTRLKVRKCHIQHAARGQVLINNHRLLLKIRGYLTNNLCNQGTRNNSIFTWSVFLGFGQSTQLSAISLFLWT